MNTRDRILETARQLFNEEGAGNVSTNKIAAELGMSSGNLHYHFKRKEQIVESLYRRFELAMEPLRNADRSVAALDDLWMTLHLAHETIGRHRFIYRDIETLMRECPLVERRAPLMASADLEGVRRLIGKLVTLNVLQATTNEIDVLAYQLVLMATSWYSFAKLIAHDAPQATVPGFAAYQALSLLAPYVNKASRPYLDYLRMKYVR